MAFDFESKLYYSVAQLTLLLSIALSRGTVDIVVLSLLLQRADQVAKAADEMPRQHNANIETMKMVQKIFNIQNNTVQEIEDGEKSVA